MPVYVRFIQNGLPIRGPVQSGIHVGWTELAAIDLAPPDGESPPMMWLLARTVQLPLALWLKQAASHPGEANLALGDGSVRMVSPKVGGGSRQTAFEPRFSGGVKVGAAPGVGSASRLASNTGSGSSPVAAEIHFTRKDGDGELVVLQALVHGVRLVGHAPIARAANDVSMEKITIAYEGITRPGASRLSADITSQVRAQFGGVRSWAYSLRRPGLLDIYDFPGDYAQRFDGIDKGGG